MSKERECEGLHWDTIYYEETPPPYSVFREVLDRLVKEAKERDKLGEEDSHEQ